MHVAMPSAQPCAQPDTASRERLVAPSRTLHHGRVEGWTRDPALRPFFNCPWSHLWSRPSVHLWTHMQIALIALEAGPIGVTPAVHCRVAAFWHTAARLSGEIWALLGGPKADSIARSLAATLAPPQAAACRTLDAAERAELERLLVELLSAFAAVEVVAVAAESLSRRLPACGHLATALLEGACGGGADATGIRPTWARSSFCLSLKTSGWCCRRHSACACLC